MAQRVIAFAGVPLGRDAAGAIASRVGLPWNMIPARSLGGAAEAGPLPSGGPIQRGERLTLIGFERAPTSLAWLARVRREDNPQKREVLIPAKAAVKLGITSQSVLDRLHAQTSPDVIRAEVARMERQTSLNAARHRGEVLDNIKRWVTTLPWANFIPYGTSAAVGLAIMEEVWPGAVADIGEEILDVTCNAPLTAIPAWVLGACSEGNRSPWWVYAAVGVGALVAIGVVIMAVRR